MTLEKSLSDSALLAEIQKILLVRCDNKGTFCNPSCNMRQTEAYSNKKDTFVFETYMCLSLVKMYDVVYNSKDLTS